MGSPFIIAISGKIGAGKNYLSNKLAEVYHQRGFTTGETTFAYALKNEATEIMNDFRNGFSDETISENRNIPLEQVHYLRFIITDELNRVTDLSGWVKTEAVRKFVQYLGTDIRRNQDYDYWVNKIEEFIPDKVDYVFIPDVRFPNEADKVLNLGGVLFRVDVPDEVILSRTNERDGLKYSQEALSHSSEHALNNYTNFDYVVGETFDPATLIDDIISEKDFTTPLVEGSE